MPGDTNDFVGATSLAEYVYNQFNPIEGVFIFLRTRTEWTVVFVLEAGYMEGVCVWASLSFPLNYPDQPPHVRFLHKLTHPHVDPATGELFPQDLFDRWNGLELSAFHVLASVKAMLLQPTRQPRQLLKAFSQSDQSPTSSSLVIKRRRCRNLEALDELIADSRALSKWKDEALQSLARIDLTGALPAGESLPAHEKTMYVVPDRFFTVSDFEPDIRNDAETFLEELFDLENDVYKPRPEVSATLNAIADQVDDYIKLMLNRIDAEPSISLHGIVNDRIAMIYDDIAALIHRGSS